jgi:hypothetical protein
MKPSNGNSSLATARAPFAPATRLEHVPIALYEILYLATVSRPQDIVPLVKSIIAVTQIDAEAFIRLPDVARLLAETEAAPAA